MPYKRKYLDPRIVDQYNDRHFGGVGGKYVLERELAILNHLMGNIQSGLFLDIPCGTGIYTDYYSNRGFGVCGADISRQMIQNARQSIGENDFVLCDAEHTPFTNECFDIVLMLRLSQHLPLSVLKRILSELKRVTKRNGTVLFDTRLWSPRTSKPESLAGMHVYHPKQVSKLMDDVGLNLVGSESAFLFSTILYRKFSLQVLKLLDTLEILFSKSLLLKTYWACCPSPTEPDHSIIQCHQLVDSPD